MNELLSYKDSFKYWDQYNARRVRQAIALLNGITHSIPDEKKRYQDYTPLDILAAAASLLSVASDTLMSSQKRFPITHAGHVRYVEAVDLFAPLRVACPECSKRLFTTSPDEMLTSYPPQQRASCVCGWNGRVRYGMIDPWWEP